VIKNGKQWYADNFHERALTHKDAVGWACEWCGRKHGEEYKPDAIQLPLLKSRKKRPKRKVVVVAHHPNYDTENPDAELIILCKACHGKAQRQHNREANQKNADDKRKEKLLGETRDAMDNGQLELAFGEYEYPILQIDFPITPFLQSVPLENDLSTSHPHVHNS